MADINFILSLAGFQSAININESVTQAFTVSPDNTQIKTIKAKQGVTTLLATDNPDLGGFKLILVQNLESQISIDVIINGDGGTEAAFIRVPPNGVYVLNSDQLIVSPLSDAFVLFDTLDRVSVRGVEAAARVKFIQVR